MFLQKVTHKYKVISMRSIDAEISTLIKELNEHGYKTYTSCIGGGGDRTDGHGQHQVEPNIGFYDLPKNILDELTKEGLQWENVGDEIEKHDGTPAHKEQYQMFFVYHEHDSSKFFRVIKKVFLNQA